MKNIKIIVTLLALQVFFTASALAIPRVHPHAHVSSGGDGYHQRKNNDAPYVNKETHVSDNNSSKAQISEAIATGHAYKKHVERGDFAKFSTAKINSIAQLQKHTAMVMSSPTHTGLLKNGAKYYYHLPTNTLVIHDPAHVDKGTVYPVDLSKYPNPIDYLKKELD